MGHGDRKEILPLQVLKPCHQLLLVSINITVIRVVTYLCICMQTWKQKCHWARFFLKNLCLLVSSRNSVLFERPLPRSQPSATASCYAPVESSTHFYTHIFVGYVLICIFIILSDNYYNNFPLLFCHTCG
jgi:hypothetical protein